MASEAVPFQNFDSFRNSVVDSAVSQENRGGDGHLSPLNSCTASIMATIFSTGVAAWTL